MKSLIASAALFASALLAAPSWAADVTSGVTDVTTDAPETGTVRDGAIEDATQFSIQGGALIAGGNAQSAAFTGSSRFMARRGPHETQALLAANYARSRVAETDTVEKTIENYQGRVRYDYFFTNNFSAFLAWQARRDQFQGLNLRMGLAPGVSYSFIRNASARLWAEVGYDLQYDMHTQAVLDEGVVEGTEVDETAIIHNARGYLGYTHQLDERLNLLLGFELFKALNEKDVRINWEAELRMQLVNKLSLAVGSTAQYWSNPLPGVRPLDVTSSMSFVYSFF